MEEKKLYYTFNSNLAAYLLTDGFKIEKVEVFERNNGGKSVDFFFKNTKELSESIKDFRENDFLVKYNANLKEVKKLVSNTLRGDKVE